MQEKIDFNNKNILITGGAGFIGSNLAIYFQNYFPKSNIVVFDCFRNEDRLSNGNLKSLGHYENLIDFKGTILCGNITNKHDLLALNDYKFDYIFHHAAISDTRVYDQELIMKTNVNSFYDILKIAYRNKAAIVYASSAATYGSLPSPNSIGNERPENPYGYSKLLMDHIANRYSRDNPDLIIAGLRFFNVYGPKEFFKGQTASMIIQFGHQILDGLKPRLFKDSHLVFRDFVYIKDVIQANIKACNPKQSGIFNIGTGISRNFQEIADILQEEYNTDLGNEYIPNPNIGYQNDTRADITESIDYLGYEPQFSLEAGIKDYLPEISRLHGQIIC